MNSFIKHMVVTSLVLFSSFVVASTIDICTTENMNNDNNEVMDCVYLPENSESGFAESQPKQATLPSTLSGLLLAKDLVAPTLKDNQLEQDGNFYSFSQVEKAQQLTINVFSKYEQVQKHHYNSARFARKVSVSGK